MLLYSNRSFFRVLIETQGSVFFNKSNLILGVLSAVACVGLQALIDGDSDFAPVIVNNYGMSAFGVIIAFSTVFRTNLAWQRYWEALSQVFYMYSKWEDAYSQFAVFARATVLTRMSKRGASDHTGAERVSVASVKMERHFSLLSALAADRLSHGDTARMDRRRETASWWTSIIGQNMISLKQDLVDLTGATRMPRFRKGTGQLQQMDSGWEHMYAVATLPTAEELMALEHAKDRVGMVAVWILCTLATVSADLDIAPPIQSRIYQEISNGMVGFCNSTKVADVPFPFPYAQLLGLGVLVFSCLIPVYVACFTQHVIAGPIISFMLYQSIWCVNEVAKELENPFGVDTNDISLEDFHARFMDKLLEIRSALDVQLRLPTTSGALPGSQPDTVVEETVDAVI